MPPKVEYDIILLPFKIKKMKKVHNNQNVLDAKGLCGFKNLYRFSSYLVDKCFMHLSLCTSDFGRYPYINNINNY